MRRIAFIVPFLAFAGDASAADAWKEHVGKPGPGGWRCHVIQPDPMNHGPDGINIHDRDGDLDLLVADRRNGIFWFDHPESDQLASVWPRRKLHPHKSMFIAVGDLNGDGNEDMAIAGGAEGTDPWKRKLTVLLRTNQTGAPSFKEIRIAQPCGNFPKGVGFLELDGNTKTREIVVVPKQGDLWMASYEDGPMDESNWKATPLPTPGADTRLKMDNAFIADIDGDGDDDIATTEENAGWGVIWFENPLKSPR